MKTFLKKFVFLLCTLLGIALVYSQKVLVPKVDASLNTVDDHAPYPVSNDAQSLHDTLIIADLHADALLWKRDVTQRHDYGHVDLPRLREGGVGIQIFSAVTKSPRGLNFDGNSADAPDDITRLVIAQLWPIRTWGSIYERAAYQAKRLQRVESKSKTRFVIARTQSDIAQPAGVLIGVLATEGSHPLEGDIDNIKRLYNAGYRMMGLQHFFDNALGGSLHGQSKSGLTEFGRAAVAKMHQMDIIVDVAHSSEAVIREVLELSPEPIIISHGGLASACPRTANRNMPDDILTEIARRGGLIGIGYFEGAICDITPKGISDAIIAAIDLMGPDAVALGSDFDGTVATSLDTSELAAITHELLARDIEADIIAKVMGGNVKRFLSQNLP